MPYYTSELDDYEHALKSNLEEAMMSLAHKEESLVVSELKEHLKQKGVIVAEKDAIIQPLQQWIEDLEQELGEKSPSEMTSDQEDHVVDMENINGVKIDSENKAKTAETKASDKVQVLDTEPSMVSSTSEDDDELWEAVAALAREKWPAAE